MNLYSNIKQEGGIKLNKLKEKMIYDKLSRVLTDYEHGNADEKDLYDMLVELQNNWSEITRG